MTSALPPAGDARSPGRLEQRPRISRTWLAIGIATLAAVLLVGGGIVVASLSGGTDKHTAAGSLAIAGSPTGSPSPTSAASPSPSPSPTPPPAGPMYHVDAGLCGKISFAGLGDWAKRPPGLTYGHPLVSKDAGADRVDCDFTAFVGAAAGATIDVSARAFPSVAQGLAAYSTVSQTPEMDGFTVTGFYDRDLKGYGEMARGYYQAATTDGTTPATDSWYMLVARTANLVLVVFVELKDLAQGPKISRNTMAARVGALTKAVLSQLHPS